MPYEEVAYWRNRIASGRNINTSPPEREGINSTERYFITQYANYPEGITLDFGVGGGRLLSLYGELGLTVVGIDIVNCYDIISQRLANLLPIPFTYIVSNDSTHIDYPDNSFEATISYSVMLHQRPDHLPLVVSEIMRVTKNNFVMSSWEPDPRPPHNLNSYCFAYDYTLLFNQLGLYIIDKKRYGEEMFYAVRRK